MYVNIASPSVLLLYNVRTVLVFNWRRQNGQNVLIKDWSVSWEFERLSISMPIYTHLFEKVSIYRSVSDICI